MDINATLSLRAGAGALAHIRRHGFSRDDIGAMAGAAGGPKWLILSHLDRYIFGEWLADAPQPIQLLGSSIGAWRFAAACHPTDPAGAIERLERAYLDQRYSTGAGRDEITAVIRGILHAFFDDNVLAGVLDHPRYRLNAITVRSRWMTASDRRALLAAGSAVAALANGVHRSSLGLFFERVVFAHREAVVHWAANGLKTRTVSLSAANARESVYASGNVPLIMDGARDPAGAPPGVYRDGGIVDYYIDQPVLDVKAGGGKLVLMPHFSGPLTPGWFDKSLPWRKPRFATNTLMIAPSAALMQGLPDARVPDRKDFTRYAGRDAARLRAWQLSLDAGERMRDAFAAFIEADDPTRFVTPL